MAEHRERFPVVVHVCLERDGCVALLKRANTGFMDGYYALPGGHQAVSYTHLRAHETERTISYDVFS